MDASSSHVVLIDQDPAVCSLVSEYLGRNDFRVTAVQTAREGLAMINSEAVDILLMEPRLRGEDALGLTRTIRESSRLPIVMVSERAEEADRVMALESGADDYVTKPFSPRELLARIRAVLRRARTELPTPVRDESLRAYRFAGWELNVKLHRLLSPQRARVRLSRGEFSLLSAFLSAPQRVLTRDQLLELSRLHSTEVYDRSIDVQILRLRRKIEVDPAHPELIGTEWGVGYVLNAPVQLLHESLGSGVAPRSLVRFSQNNSSGGATLP
jgi:two-component system, OmpR family, response regulator